MDGQALWILRNLVLGGAGESSPHADLRTTESTLKALLRMRRPFSSKFWLQDTACCRRAGDSTRRTLHGEMPSGWANQRRTQHTSSVQRTVSKERERSASWHQTYPYCSRLNVHDSERTSSWMGKERDVCTFVSTDNWRRYP